jgi:hypothetical protein
MKVKVEFVFEMEVPDTANYEQKNNLIGNVLDDLSAHSDGVINPVEFTWRKAWSNHGQEN